ncbi:serine hydrolase domain-containing protein [Marivirga harenae]|uniref:serine hydrolase domain-containing protein n=1 Tax=Marivirga harenae TaxID=2010992 RepID=UPI0026E0CF79|nr:serine hydrolase domain-containing protein [Marivirga harenae]WKV12762.1 serine hydrolase domain-containing protein [Marivirga harenae]|tara:strand:- start:110407 stop:111438 length:1032 start_codon:yes stop_codon:yes gene_type:complete
MDKKKAKLIVRILLFVGTAISLYFVPWPVVFAWLSPLPNSLQEQVDRAGDYGFDGIIVYVDKKGEAPRSFTSGYKNRATKTPADPNSLFKIASVDKLYTALAIAKMSRSGQLSLDQSLAFYLPELKGKIEYADEISLKMMVQHRSGIPNYTNTHLYWVAPKESDEEKLGLILNLPANFKPGEDYQYSNTNYLLLGKIMDEVLGYDHFQYIQEEILKPLDLKNTFASIQDVDLADVMSGYYVGYEQDLKTDNVGSMLATAADLSTFIRALNEGTIFTDEEEQKIYASIYEFEHTGLIPGYQTIAKYHPEMDAVVIQFTNTVNFDGYNWNLSEVMYSRVVKILKD